MHLMKRFVVQLGLVLAVLVSACGGSSSSSEEGPGSGLPAADLNDVSILFPLPTPTQLDRLLAPGSLAAFGPVLPDDVQALLPPLDPFRPNSAVLPSMRVVALRLDPCMRGMPGTEGCQAQVRLVLQPLRVDGAQVLADDQALHAFYRLTSAEFQSFLHKLRSWRFQHERTNRGGLLRIHPLLSAAGWESSVAQELRSLLLENMGQERLQRLTFMQLQGLKNQWRFGGLERTNSGWQPITIPHVNAAAQTFSNILVHSDLDFVATVVPAQRPPDDFSLVFNSGQATQADAAALKTAHAATLRVENPLRHDTRSMDCVSCHTAASARTWLQARGVDGEQPGDRFQSLHPLGSSGAAFKPAVLRAFGYFGSEPVISQRTINETAEVLHQLQP